MGMKRTFALLLLLTTFTAAQAQEMIGYYTGVWYSTKAITPSSKQAGYMEFFFYDDGSLLAEFYYNREIVSTAQGFYWDTRTGGVFSFYDSDGWYYKGNVKNQFLSGTFNGGSQRGKFQGN
jgi:hypothetical protein